MVYNMKKIILSLILLSIFYFLFSVFVAQAALVPCGPGVGDSCKWNDLYVLFKKIIDFAIYNLVFPISAVMIVVGGGFIMTASGSTSRVAKGKEILTAAIVGLLIALLSWLIIDTIIKILAPDFESKFGPWNQL